MKDLWAALKKNPAMLIGFIFLIFAVLYIVYKSSAANKQGGVTAGSASDPNAQSGVAGGYLMFEEDVINPSPVNVTVGKTTVNTKTIVPVDHDKKHHRVHGGASHPPVRMPQPPPHITHIKSPVPLQHPPQHNTRVARKA